MNFYKNHFGMIVSSVIAICVSLVMATAAIFVDHLTFTIPLWVKNWGTAFLVITICGMIFPLTDWSFALGRKLNLKPETLPHVLLENTVATLVFNLFATLILAGVNIFNNPEIAGAIEAGFLPYASVNDMYIHTVLHDLPIMFVISFICAFFITKVAIRVAKKSLGLDTLATEESPQHKG